MGGPGEVGGALVQWREPYFEIYYLDRTLYQMGQKTLWIFFGQLKFLHVPVF